MKLYTNPNNHTYDIKWIEYWDDRGFFLAETCDGQAIEIDLDNFNKIERE